MIARVSRAKSGLSKYLRDGQRQDSEYSRDQKDQTIPLFGDLDIFEKTEHFLNQHKDYSDNYMHITLSFNKEDIRRIEESGKDPLDVYRDMVQDYIKHHTSGYDIDDEVIAYAEVHRPKIQEEHGKERLEHIHIGIALYNPLDDTKLRTDFKHSNFFDDTLQEFVNKKHGLTNPREFSRDRQGINADTNTARDRKFYINELKDIGSREELLQYFQDNGINFREVETAKNHYFKIQTPGDKNDINLRGRGFEHLADIAQGKEIKANASRDVQQLGKILTDHYEKRIDQIDRRRSAQSKEAIKGLYEEEGGADRTDTIYPSYRHKILSKHYGQMIDRNWTGWWIDTQNQSGVSFNNYKRNINVVDRGKEVTSNGSGSLQERVSMMLDIAEAKGWDIKSLDITGSKEFKKEIQRQIAERIREREELLKNPAAIEITRPTSEAEKLAAVLADEKQVQKLSSTVDLATIKSELSAATVLQYAADKFKLNTANHELTNDNKINNLNNKQKPKNVIDFMQKELNLSGQEAIEICRDLYNQQRQTPNLQTAPMPGAKTNLNTGVSNVTTAQRIVALREPNTQPDRRRKTNTADNLPVLSSSELVSDLKSIELLLQNHDDADLQRRSQETGNGLRYAAAGNDTAPSRSAIIGDITMPLKISICKDSNPNALNKWESVEVASYTELATLMKQYPYSAAQFENGYRNSDNAKASGNVLIYDIDNDQGKPQLTIEEAQKLLESKGVSAMILPSKSHNTDKNGHIAERFRIVIPTAETLPAGIEKEEYREFQKLAAKVLDLDRHVDTKALNDKARFYYKSPVAAAPRIVKSDHVMKIDALQLQARSNLTARRAEAEAEQARIEQIRRNVAKHRTVTAEAQTKYLTQADTEKMMSLKIADLIRHFEKGEEYKEGAYHMIKTDGAKYSIVEDNVAHDFKNDVTYNSIAFLQKHFKTQNLNAIARELEKETGESYLRTNEEMVKRVVDAALKNATNDRNFEDQVKEFFEAKYCKFDPSTETLTIADRQVKLSDIGYNKQQVINALRDNRERVEGARRGPSIR